jgi:hypothetical protein
MNSVNCKTFTAQITIGLFRGYSNISISVPEFKNALLKAQENIKTQSKIKLSAKLTMCEILFLGQEEPSVDLQFIQYPKFPQEESALKKAIVELTEQLMAEFEQNRVVIVFADETIMLERSSAIDPTIQI